MAAQAGSQELNVLGISDVVDQLIYGNRIRERFGHVDLVLGCGDLPYYYLEYIVSMLDVPLYYVNGNHAPRVEHGLEGSRSQPWGTVNLHGRTVNHAGLLIAGLEGSRRYNSGAHQYTESEMRLQVGRLIPRLLLNRARYGRFLDVLITHAPPLHIHDQPDRCHQGFAIFRWFLQVFQPRYHLHGHIHVYGTQTATQTRFHRTLVVNVFGFRELRVDLLAPSAPPLPRRTAPKAPLDLAPERLGLVPDQKHGGDGPQAGAPSPRQLLS